MTKRRIGILYAGDHEARRNATPENGRFLNLFQAFAALGAQAEPVVYHDDFKDEVARQAAQLDAVIAWVNPIEGGRDRLQLDSMLRELSDRGVFVSTHPDVILKLGTKEILISTKSLGWGSDCHMYTSLEQMRRELPARLSAGEARVLKQYRGHSGDGIWRIERASRDGAVTGESLVRVRHAKTGHAEEVMSLNLFFERCQSYFMALEGQGRMIDQRFEARLPEGMVRCYLVGGQVEGFGRQEIVALHPTEFTPTKRHYHPATMPEFQRLKALVEKEWVPGVRRLLGLTEKDLPMLWDCDFLFGAKDQNGLDTYVLCEINVSCVSPFPESAAGPLAKAVLARLNN